MGTSADRIAGIVGVPNENNTVGACWGSLE